MTEHTTVPPSHETLFYDPLSIQDSNQRQDAGRRPSFATTERGSFAGTRAQSLAGVAEDLERLAKRRSSS